MSVLLDEQLHTARLVERAVVDVRPRHCEQLRDDAFVHFGILPQVQCGEVEAEHAHAPSQASQPPTREQ